MTAVVRVTDVFVAYRSAAGPVMALRGADLTVGTGERLLVSGPNGSGKSTLLRVVTGDQPVLAGTVEVGGEAVHAMDADARRAWRSRAVGSVDQQARRNLLPELDVVDNVALQLRLTGTAAAPARERARRTLERLGLARLASTDVRALSGGEAQRVALCAAVAHGPALLLADEPTGELDDDAARDVYGLLDAVAADGTGVVLVSHDPRARGFVDRAVRLRDGRLAEQWAPGSDEVEQVPDSRGWVRLPTELLTAGVGSTTGWVVDAVGAGLLLRPAGGAGTGTPTPPAPGEQPAPARTRPREPARPVPAGATAAGEPLVALRGVRGGYGDRTLFAHLDLVLERGSWTCVRGPSGSGKSTLLAVVAGLVDPLDGAVAVAGTAWAGLGRDERASHRGRWVAVAPQRPGLVEAMTVRENLALTLAVRGSASAAGTVGPLAEALGLSRLLDGEVGVLSGGERQRAALARALVSPAPLLVLDEPTSQQDEASAARVVAALRAEVAAGRAVLVASHDPALLGAADRTVDLDPHGARTASAHPG